jgi:asparagine synthase (glutamine-hydrolysing)
MCGITGIVDLRGDRSIDESVLRRMNGLLTHRGPDGDGFHFSPGVGFGHRRLSIIDLEGGRQPLYNEDGSVVVTFNGEIFNFMEVEAELLARGHTFRTRSDTEVIVHAWEEWGTECLQTLQRHVRICGLGRAAEDAVHRPRPPRREAAVLRRDLGRPAGVRLRAQGDHGRAGMPRRIDPRAVEEYFTFGYVPDPKTIYHDVKKLEPGTYLLHVRGNRKLEPVRYWDVPLAGERRPEGSPETWESELRERLREAVRKRLVSDVPLGAFLSGGIDSSAVVAMMREIGAGKILTCSIGFKEPQYDESQYARMVAEAKQTDHKAEVVEASDYSLLDQLVGIYDEPYADSSAIPTYRVCQLARTARHGRAVGRRRRRGFHRLPPLPAVRDGRGGAKPRSRGRAPRRVRPARPLVPQARLAPRFVRGKTTFQALARGTVDAYLHGVSICSQEMRAQLYSPAFRRELQGYDASEVFHGHARGKSFDDALSLVQYLDYKTYLPGDILTKVDRASMAHSLEVRTPFLDYEFVEWAASLPAEVKLRGGEARRSSRRRSSPCCRARCCTARRWASRCRSTSGSAVRSRNASPRPSRARGSPSPASSTRPSSRAWWTITTPGAATTARRCGRC